MLSAAIVAGFFGSSHCIGMCGAIVVLFEKDSASKSRWLRRVLYNTGRLGFYVLLGSVAGTSGALLTNIAGVSTGLFLLRLLAAGMVIAVGLSLLCKWSLTTFFERAGAAVWRKLSPLARFVLPVTTPIRAMAAGFLWGALPCGLVYSAAAMAATAGSVTGGALVMLAFWAGTLPALLVTGASASSLHQLKSQKFWRRTAGATMLILGVLALTPLFSPVGHSSHTSGGPLTHENPGRR